ncbi:DUF221-domain-containing protein [Gloeophyllum trabeum ATCC 11539]|uniref:DUF221-domain-containing protein n=1 Tax=Gloeophyllum trabeum (strain ATCC 11539 / FP-39264 / Madison 617) TaxID=670483 RepID=S7RGB1_GLOTA|nr:DUF221-domain-containing protein [Gloeophyllum trabeum ATCC 11539]EPQ51564.1 DUF221-domain-containing protein [Gloeophyllum trabeum ATCC 11539]
MDWPVSTFNGTWDEPAGPPPGSPPTYKFEGPWFTTQLILSATIGLVSFLLFSYCRTRWPLLFAPRTKLKGFSPHEAHAHQAFFGWILPTIRTSEYTILQIVGLDAAVLLNFFKMSFYLFSVCSVFATFTLMPINLRSNIGIGDEDEDSDWPSWGDSFASPNTTKPKTPTDKPTDWLDLISDANSYLTIHLLFTYLFTLLSLWFIYRNYRRFIRARQLFSLELVHSIPARTAMLSALPPHLQSERALAEYFEGMNLAVESVTICREVGSLKRLLDKRTDALLQLEQAWTKYVGNPSTVEAYDPSSSAPAYTDGEPGAVEAQQPRLVVPHRKRPSIRPGWFKPKVDALEYLQARFAEADAAVQAKRRSGKFRATQTAFVTFEKMSSAQIAVQTAHAPAPAQCLTHQAPEPRDIVWANMSHSPRALVIRETLVLAAICVLLLFWLLPITFLASLLSYKEIKKAWPWLGRLIDRNDKVQAIVQNSLPSVAMMSLNALLPFLLEALTYLQGYRARSWIEYSLLKKYFLFLLTNVVFIFLLASTYWQLVRDLANSPGKIPEKLAEALQKGRARHFFLSYVILQGIGIMPLQLLNLGVIIPKMLFRVFTRTPRDFAELNAPPMINYGVVYPQAILIFTITILYSIVQPLIVIFGAIYFGVAYVVYKYKLLFVFYKPYESQGQAWPITFTRLIWGVVIFQIFMIGNFILRQSYVLSFLVGPLLAGTLFWAWQTDKTFRPLSKYVSLSSVYEVERGEETADVVRLRAGHPVTWSQSNLNRRRYAQNDETLYVAPEDARTDYSQPPMANWYSGVLNTGKRRYGHPALTGVLPQPWLPLKKGQALVNNGRPSQGKKDEAVVLTLRKRVSVSRRASRHLGSRGAPTAPLPEEQGETQAQAPRDVEDPWRDDASGSSRRLQPHQQHLAHRLSYDHGSGVIMLPEDGAWLDEEESDSEDDFGSPIAPGSPANGSEEPAGEQTGQQGQGQASTISEGTSPANSKQRYGTYYHHPERRRQTIPGAFSPGHNDE